MRWSPRVSVQGQPSVPRFASEELAEEEFSPLFESQESRRSLPPAHGEACTSKEAAPEPAPFALQPQPVLIEEAFREPPRCARCSP